MHFSLFDLFTMIMILELVIMGIPMIIFRTVWSTNLMIMFICNDNV